MKTGSASSIGGGDSSDANSTNWASSLLLLRLVSIAIYVFVPVTNSIGLV